MPQPADRDDALLLEELMNGPGEASEAPTTGFTAEWNKLFGDAGGQGQQQQQSGIMAAAAAGGFDEDFGQFVSSRGNQAAAGGVGGDLSSLQLPQQQQQQQQQQPQRQHLEAPSSFLPSQLFERDQSFHPGAKQGMLNTINFILR